jgi:hypothetical protein
MRIWTFYGKFHLLLLPAGVGWCLLEAIGLVRFIPDKGQKLLGK